MCSYVPFCHLLTVWIWINYFPFLIHPIHCNMHTRSLSKHMSPDMLHVHLTLQTKVFLDPSWYQTQALISQNFPSWEFGVGLEKELLTLTYLLKPKNNHFLSHRYIDKPRQRYRNKSKYETERAFCFLSS